MKLSLKNLALPAVTIILLLIAVAWMAGLFTEKLAPGSTAPARAQHSNAVSVVTQELAVYEYVPASIEAKQATIISSRILARIDKIHVNAGDMVKQGQLLLELEKSDLQSRASQAEAAVQSVSARLTEAKQSLSRSTDLTNRGLLAKADLDKAQANHDALAADLANSKQALSEARAALSFAQVRAPISGRIVDRLAEPGDTAQPGIPLLSLYNPLSLRVEANIREQLALTLTTGQSLAVTIPALNQSLNAEIEEIVPAGNTGSRSFLVKSRLQQSTGLLPGMYAKVQIPAGTRTLVLIPEDRVARVGQLDIAWVVSNGVVERRLIRTGKTYPGQMIEIISGLEANEQVIPVQY